MTIIAAADGSSLGNPGATGWAWYIDEANWCSGGLTHGTNNQGELLAVLELLRATASEKQTELIIYADSKYVIDALTKWLPGWKRKNWRKADGSAVLNKDILQQLDSELSGRKVRFEWIKGHAGHALNEKADTLARAAASRYRAGAGSTLGPGFVGALRTTNNIQHTIVDVRGGRVRFNEADASLIPDVLDTGSNSSVAHKSTSSDESTTVKSAAEKKSQVKNGAANLSDLESFAARISALESSVADLLELKNKVTQLETLLTNIASQLHPKTTDMQSEHPAPGQLF